MVDVRIMNHRMSGLSAALLRLPAALLELPAVFLAVTLGCGAAPAAARPASYTIDMAGSRVDFGVQCFGLVKYGGRFSRFSGKVTLDPEHWETLRLRIEIPVDSLESRPRFWRHTLLGPSFFDAGRYPNIDFGAMTAARTGKTSAEATGNLTIRSTTRPLRLAIIASPNAESIEVTTDTTLKRSDFGLGGVLPFASDDVTVSLRLRLVPDAPHP
jgi:polyisoprenoid-binding protein YceI